MKNYYVYILSNQARGTIYIGVTNDINRRLQEHLNTTKKGFTHKYNLERLVYIEQINNVEAAIQLEKQL